MDNPKLFISYSWSNPDHEQFVLNLATELRESGVEAILDKWDLKEGHDAIAFMEKMVTDPEIQKVIIISDKMYAEKANGRAGGVGTETQIISSEVYQQQEQSKFVAIVTEKDSSGKAYLPVYYKSRMYIDFSEQDNYNEGFEQLLRWIYNKPLFVKPEIGKRPSFLDDSDSITLGTTACYKRAVTAIRENKSFMTGAIDEYLTIFSNNLENFRITEKNGEFDDQVIDNIDKFLPFRDEAISLFSNIAQYAPTEENINKLHRFFEALIPYRYRPANVNRWSEYDFDNFKFIIHEMYLYIVAILIKNERFELLNKFLTQQYYVGDISDFNRNSMVGYDIFREHLISLEHRNRRLKLNRLSLSADLLKQRSTHANISFEHIMQADFLLYIRSVIQNGSTYFLWYPDTLVYKGRFNQTFEIFARASSKSYFDKIKSLLLIESVSDLDLLMGSFKSNRKDLPRWQFESIDPESLLGYQNLSTMP
ncbi:SEFIR domain-containing protein [Providencia sp. PROV120]|uniref:SEFIR domain-containing protein n=1 Tax=Providencia sp. PROV120 TaxID=2949831 RepID=UPI00234BA500|nr:SEFIR domain-containing protein [Providencia sp. PROV120]